MSQLPTIEPTPLMGPILPQDRIEVLDILRGFAIFGILLVNMDLFSSPVYPVVTDVTPGMGTVDDVAAGLIRLFAEGKFYPLFSFLFGLGFTLQMTRAESRGARFVLLYRRRLFALLLIGLAHAFLLWAGDILVVYALLGFILLLFRVPSRRTLMVWTFICLLIPILLHAGLLGLVELAESVPALAEQVDAWFEAAEANYQALTEQSLHAYSRGTFAEITAQRVQDLSFYYLDVVGGWFTLAPHIFAMFLLGLYVGRSGFLQNISAHFPRIRSAMRWGLGVGLAANMVFVLAGELSDPLVPSFASLLETVCFFLGAPMLSLFYASAIILLLQRGAWQKRLAPLAAVGRTALSNYLFQSLICTTIFYSYGLGLYGKVGPAGGLVLTVVIFTVQLALSGWWLRRFQFGPMEWLWRSLTYQKRQPMRVGAHYSGQKVSRFGA